MKSYFAKLAARATLANAPAPKPVNARSTPDLLEITTASPDTTPSAAIWPAHRSSAEALAKRDDLARTSPQTIELRPQTESTIAQTHKTSTTAAPPSTEELSTTETASITELRPTRQTSDTRNTTRAESPDEGLAPTTKPHQLSPDAERTPLQFSSTSSKEREESQSPDDGNVNDRLASVENEQAILLRKADAFMAGMFERRPRSSERSEPEEHESETQHRPIRSESLSQPPTRLQPPSATDRVSETATEEPSLVIGKLSVEVVPTPAPAIAPQRQVVVIGGGRRTRAGIPSAHRFGFSRY